MPVNVLHVSCASVYTGREFDIRSNHISLSALKVKSHEFLRVIQYDFAYR